MYVFSEMRELRQTTPNADEDIDSDEETRYGNGVAINGNRRASGSARKRYDVNHPIRQTNTERSLRAKNRVIRMLFVVVLEFFICWTPVYVLQTWYVLDAKSVRQHVSPMAMNMVHLLSYVSSCCNPITYCFMNKRFRQGFLAAFDCCGMRKRRQPWREASSFGTSQRTGKFGQKTLNFRYQSTIQGSPAGTPSTPGTPILSKFTPPSNHRLSRDTSVDSNVGQSSLRRSAWMNNHIKRDTSKDSVRFVNSVKDKEKSTINGKDKSMNNGKDKSNHKAVFS